MPATLLPLPRARFFTAAGLPLAGGKVFTYVAGTTTLLPSYTDYSGTVANTNPVILDSTGEANIWLGNGLYKIVLTDANDVVQWTVDNVGQNNVADLAAGFGIATNIASAATVDLGTLASHFGNITGATTITSFGSTATLDAPLYLIKFNGALTLTNSGNLITPTGANITTANNDRAWVEYLGSGAWRIIGYMKADGTPLSVGVVGAANGGTGQSSYTVGDLLYATGATALSKLAVGTTGQVLGVTAGAPAWIAPFAGAPAFESAEQTITAGTTLTIGHGLGRKPYYTMITLRCKTTDRGYAVGDEIVISEAGGNISEGLTAAINATNIVVTVSSAAIPFYAKRRDPTVGAVASLTTSNWRIVCYAW